MSGLEEMGQSYFNNTSKKEKAETQVCDCGEEKEGAESKTLKEYGQDPTENERVQRGGTRRYSG